MLFSFELIIFVIITFIYLRIKQKNPDFLYPLTNISFFLPPQPEDLVALKKQKEANTKNYTKFQKSKYQIKQNQTGAALPVKMMKSKAEHLLKLKYSGEFDLVVMLSTILFLQVIVANSIKYFIPNTLQYSYFHSPTNLSVYLSVFIFFFTLSKLVIANSQTIQSYETKISVFVTMLCFLMNLVFFFGFQDFFDLNIEQSLQKFANQIQNVIYEQNNDSYQSQQVAISYETILVIFCALNSLLVFGSVPAIIKFGNTYVNLQKKIQTSDENDNDNDDENNNENNKENQEKQSKPESETDKEKTEKFLRKRNLKMYFIFNCQLITSLLLIFLWIKPIATPLKESVNLKIVQLFIIIINIILTILPFKFEVEQFMFKSYKQIQTLINDFSDLNFQNVQIQVRYRFQSMVFVSYQILCRFAIPTLILIVILQKGVFQNQETFVANQNTKLLFRNPVTHENQLLLNYDFNCPIVKDPRILLWEKSHCFVNPQLNFNKKIHYFGAYIDIQYTQKEQNQINENKEQKFNLMSDVKTLFRKLNIYNLIPNEIYEHLFYFLLFNYYLFTFIITILYILFVAKITEL